MHGFWLRKPRSTPLLRSCRSCCSERTLLCNFLTYFCGCNYMAILLVIFARWMLPVTDSGGGRGGSSPILAGCILNNEQFLHGNALSGFMGFLRSPCKVLGIWMFYILQFLHLKILKKAFLWNLAFHYYLVIVHLQYFWAHWSIYFTVNFDVACVWCLFIDTFGTWKLQF